MLSDTAPFHAGSTISDSRYFVGYQEQLDTITVRAISAQPTSINVVGDKRTGKSSLLYHFCQTYEQRIESRGKNPRNYLAVYLSLEAGNCQHKSSFYRVVEEELCKNLEQRYDWFRKPRRLIDALKANNFNTGSFYQAIVQFREVDILPILCLDKIEALFKHPEEFNDGFYDNLRSLMDRNALMLVIASRKNLNVYSRRQKLTSSFFNLGQVMILKGFTDNEARDLVRLPQTTIPGSQAVLNEDEQQIALEWGGKNPYLLQLAGLYFWEAKQSNQDINWAKKRFDRQAKGISVQHSIWRKCLLLLKWVFWRLPVKLGQAIKFIGTTLDELSAWVLGVFIVGILILAALKILPWESVIEAVKNALGIGE
ncbi:MAG: AAA-like domain-containing protein [Xenococcaceae cyanobacterium]